MMLSSFEIEKYLFECAKCQISTRRFSNTILSGHNLPSFSSISCNVCTQCKGQRATKIEDTHDKIFIYLNNAILNAGVITF